MKIGIYDSGLGGLHIMQAIRKSMPTYDYVFYGDTALLPLGDKSESVIYEAVARAVRTLFAHECALVVVACNTASVATVRKIQDTIVALEFPDRRVLGIVIPTVERVIVDNPRRVLIIGTQRTISSKKFEHEIRVRNPEIRCVSVATPQLVPLIESGYLDDAFLSAVETIEAARAVQGVDMVVLGCTHYGVLKELLRERFGTSVHVLAQDEIIPMKLKEYFVRHEEIVNILSSGGTEHVYLTKNLPQYGEVLGKTTILPYASHSDTPLV